MSAKRRDGADPLEEDARLFDMFTDNPFPPPPSPDAKMPVFDARIMVADQVFYTSTTGKRVLDEIGDGHFKTLNATRCRVTGKYGSNALRIYTEAREAHKPRWMPGSATVKKLGEDGDHDTIQLASKKKELLVERTAAAVLAKVTEVISTSPLGVRAFRNKTQVADYVCREDVLGGIYVLNHEVIELLYTEPTNQPNQQVVLRNQGPSQELAVSGPTNPMANLDAIVTRVSQNGGTVNVTMTSVATMNVKTFNHGQQVDPAQATQLQNLAEEVTELKERQDNQDEKLGEISKEVKTMSAKKDHRKRPPVDLTKFKDAKQLTFAPKKPLSVAQEPPKDGDDEEEPPLKTPAKPMLDTVEEEGFLTPQEGEEDKEGDTKMPPAFSQDDDSDDSSELSTPPQQSSPGVDAGAVAWSSPPVTPSENVEPTPGGRLSMLGSAFRGAKSLLSWNTSKAPIDGGDSSSKEEEEEESVSSAEEAVVETVDSDEEEDESSSGLSNKEKVIGTNEEDAQPHHQESEEEDPGDIMDGADVNNGEFGHDGLGGGAMDDVSHNGDDVFGKDEGSDNTVFDDSEEAMEISEVDAVDAVDVNEEPDATASDEEIASDDDEQSEVGGLDTDNEDQEPDEEVVDEEIASDDDEQSETGGLDTDNEDQEPDEEVVDEEIASDDDEQSKVGGLDTDNEDQEPDEEVVDVEEPAPQVDVVVAPPVVVANPIYCPRAVSSGRACKSCKPHAVPPRYCCPAHTEQARAHYAALANPNPNNQN